MIRVRNVLAHATGIRPGKRRAFIQTSLRVVGHVERSSYEPGGKGAQGRTRPDGKDAAIGDAWGAFGSSEHGISSESGLTASAMANSPTHSRRCWSTMPSAALSGKYEPVTDSVVTVTYAPFSAVRPRAAGFV